MSVKTGIYEDMPFAEYLSIPAVSATAIKQGARSMLHMKHVMDGVDKKETKAMSFGTLAHTAVLERDKLKDVPVWTGGRRQGKVWEEFKKDHGEEVATATEMHNAKEVSRRVMENPEARMIVNGSRSEVVIVWQTSEYGLAKARIDALGATFLADLKTTSQIDERAFTRQFWSGLRYYLQIGWYFEGCRQLSLLDQGATAYVIAAETSDPFDVAVYKCDHDVLSVGREGAVKIATDYHSCSVIKQWPGVASGKLVQMEVPEYMRTKVEIEIEEDDNDE